MAPTNVIGIDLGGTKIALARYDAETLSIEEESKTETHAHQGFDHVLRDLVEMVRKLKNTHTAAIGIGVPGLVRQNDGVLLHAPNIENATDIPVKEQLSSALKLPVAVDNDAHCFTLAEAMDGAGKGRDVVIGITMGTGVGGGVVINGKLYHGAHGYAAEIGHMLMQPGSPPYQTDNKRGDVEQFLSGSAMGKRCAEASSPEEYLEGEVCAFLRPDLFKEVAWMCTNLIHAFDPSIIVFGGSAGRALKPYLKTIESELKKWLLPQTPVPDLAVAILKDAATLGAARLAVRQISA